MKLEANPVRIILLIAALLFTVVPEGNASLIGYWAMEEGSGTTTANTGTNGNAGPLVDGVFVGNVGWVIGDPTRGTVLSFSGTGAVGGEGYVDAGDVVIGDTDDYTWSVWVNASGIGDDVILGARTPDSGGLWNKLTPLKYQPITLGTETATVNFPGVVTTGVWTHMAVTRRGSNVDVYINGSNVGSSSTSTGNNSGGGPFYIGGDSDFAPEQFNGLIDDAAVWDYALTAGQIGELVSGTPPPAIVPEPSATVLVSFLLFGLIGFGRRRRKRGMP